MDGTRGAWADGGGRAVVTKYLGLRQSEQREVGADGRQEGVAGWRCQHAGHLSAVGPQLSMGQEVKKVGLGTQLVPQQAGLVRPAGRGSGSQLELLPSWTQARSLTHPASVSSSVNGDSDDHLGGLLRIQDTTS